MASESVCVMFGCICISMYMCEEFPVEIQALVMLRLLHKLRIRLFLLIVRDGGCRRSQVKDDAEKYTAEVSELQTNGRDIQESCSICDSQIENNPTASAKNESKKQESESSVSECPQAQSSSEVIENVPPTSVSEHRSGIQIPMLSSTCCQESEEIWDGMLSSHLHVRLLIHFFFLFFSFTHLHYTSMNIFNF